MMRNATADGRPRSFNASQGETSCCDAAENRTDRLLIISRLAVAVGIAIDE